jgi:pilus assembly protein CpaB
MNRRLLAILLLAFVIAALCALLVYRLVNGKLAATRQPAITNVMAASEDIKLGAILAANNLTTIKIYGTTPKGAILEKDKSSLIGRGVVSDLYQGEPIIQNRLAAPGSGGGLAATIPPGMRALAVKVDEVVGVAGFVTPGMRVDVLVSGIPPGNRPPSEGTVAKTVLQNVQVLSAGTDIQKDAEGKPKQVQVVNLLVSPQDAETLTLASNQQVKIQLVLRNPLDTKIDTVSGTAMGTIFSDRNAAPQPKPVSKPVVKVVRPAASPEAYTVEVINGTKRSEVKIGSSEGQK